MSFQKTKSLFLTLGILLICGCSLRPSADNAKEFIVETIKKTAHGCYVMTAFKKTNGYYVNVDGNKRYCLEYEAEFQFTKNCIWLSEDYGADMGFCALEVIPGKVDVIASTLSHVSKKAGERVKVKSIIIYWDTDNGWSPATAKNLNLL